jgi:hypothetical protein
MTQQKKSVAPKKQQLKSITPKTNKNQLLQNLYVTQKSIKCPTKNKIYTSLKNPSNAQLKNGFQNIKFIKIFKKIKIKKRKTLGPPPF